MAMIVSDAPCAVGGTFTRNVVKAAPVIWDKQIVENVKAVVAAVQAAKPATVKGVFIKSMSISSTMGVGVPVIVAADAE